MPDNDVEEISESFAYSNDDVVTGRTTLSQLHDDIKQMSEQVHDIIKTGYIAAVRSLLPTKATYTPKGKTKPVLASKPHHRKRQR